MSDGDIESLRQRLDDLPAPLEPLDVMAIDGYLCGVILQPGSIPVKRWFAHVIDVDGRTAPASAPVSAIRTAVARRHGELQRAIDGRCWFDPWIFALDGDAPPTAVVLPWVAGFALALNVFPALSAIEEPALIEPLALLYLHFERADVEDAGALVEMIESLEPPPDLAEAVQDIVRAVMLIADVTRPLRGASA